MASFAACAEVMVKPPSARDGLPDHKNVRIFLAGSIEMGKAADWQANMASEVVEKVSQGTIPRVDLFCKWTILTHHSHMNLQA